jgi:hypothetical protein
MTEAFTTLRENQVRAVAGFGLLFSKITQTRLKL